MLAFAVSTSWEHRTVFDPGFCALFDCSALLKLKAATEGHHNNVKKSGDKKNSITHICVSNLDQVVIKSGTKSNISFCII